MTITNGYTTLANIRALRALEPTDTASDAIIERAVEQASRVIDNVTQKTFYARTETHYYEPESIDGRTLTILDDYLLTITTLTDGAGNVIPSTEYRLYPLNKSPKWQIVLNADSTYNWNCADGDVVTVAGTWAFVATAPMDIQGVCEDLVLRALNARYGMPQGDVTVTGAGVILTPKMLTADNMRVLSAYTGHL